MFMKRFKAAVVLICLVFTGCAGGGEPTGLEQQATTKITLVTSSVYADAIRGLIQSFEETNSDIRVNCIEMRGALNELYDIYTAPLIAEDSTVDVFLLDNVWIPNFGAKKFAEPLAYSEQEKSSFEAAVLSECLYEGELIALPFSIDLSWIYYRRDLIDAPPSTWEDWIALGRQLAQEQKVRYGGVIQGQDGEEMLCTAREIINSSSDIATGLSLYKEILSLGGQEVNLDSTTYVKAFSQGEAAFMKAGSTAWHIVNQNGSEVKMKVGIVPLPAGSDGSAASLLGGSSLAVNRFSEKKEAAFRLVRYLTGEEAQLQAAVEFGLMPTRIAVYENYRVAEENPHFDLILPEGYGQFIRKGASVSYLEWTEPAEESLEAYLSGAMDVATAAAGIEAFLKYE